MLARTRTSVAVTFALLVVGSCSSPKPESDGAVAPSGQTQAEPQRHDPANTELEPATGGTDPSADVPPTPAHEAGARSRIVDGARIIAADAMPGLAAFAQAWPGGAMWIGKLAGNGGRDVLIYVPPAPDAAARVRLVFHFHGTYGERITPEAPGMPKKEWVGHKRLTQTLEAMDELQGAGQPNVALVYPISAGKRPEPGWKGWFNKEYDRMWMSPAPQAGYTDDFNRLYDEAVAVITDPLGVASELVDRKALVEGHSAGGIALRNLAEAGTTRVAEYLFLDASFHSWSDRCWAAVAEGKGAAQVTIVQTTKGIADPHEGRDPWCRIMPLAAAAWPDAREFCEQVRKPSKTKPPGSKESCEALKTAAEEWPKVRQWCADLANDFRGIDGLTLVRTKVSHGEQPRHFSGGLELGNEHPPPRP